MFNISPKDSKNVIVIYLSVDNAFTSLNNLVTLNSRITVNARMTF